MPIGQFSGIASGIDTKSLIDALIAAKEAVNVKRQAEIDHLTSENSALDELNTKLLSLDELISEFRTANSGGLAKKGASSDPTVATATVGANANNASYSLNVTAIANSANGSFDHSYSSSTEYVSTSGSGDLTITVGTGSDQVTITTTITANSMTLEDLVNAINNDSSSSGRVAASAVNVGTDASPDYRLVLSTLNQGTAEGNLALSVDAGVTELAASTINQATNASFTISGINGTITRSSNTVSDVISGITFNLLDTGASTISISNDADTTADKLAAIVDAYNDIIEFVNDNNVRTQDEQSSEGTVIYGSLAKTRVDEDFLSVFREKIAAITSDSGTSVTTFSELGVATNRDGTLDFDVDTFKEAVASDSVGVGEVLNSFADSLSGIEGSIYSFTQLEGYIDVAINSNNDQIENLEEAIAQLKRASDKYRERLQGQFTRLELISGRLQQQQAALSGIL